MADRYTEWHRNVTRVKRVIQDTFHSNDMNHKEAEAELRFAFDELATAFGMPKVNWDAEDEEGAR